MKKNAKSWGSVFYGVTLTFLLAFSFNETVCSAEYRPLEGDPHHGRLSRCVTMPPGVRQHICPTAATLLVSALECSTLIHQFRNQYSEYTGEDWPLKLSFPVGTVIGTLCLGKCRIHFDRFKALPSEIRKVLGTYERHSWALPTAHFLHAVVNDVGPMVGFAAAAHYNDKDIFPFVAVALPCLAASNFFKGIKVHDESLARLFDRRFVPWGEVCQAHVVLATAFFLLGSATKGYFIGTGLDAALLKLNAGPDIRKALAITVGATSGGLSFAFDSLKWRAIKFPSDCWRTTGSIVSVFPTLFLYFNGAFALWPSPYPFEVAITLTALSGLVYLEMIKELFSIRNPEDEEVVREEGVDGLFAVNQ